MDNFMKTNFSHGNPIALIFIGKFVNSSKVTKKLNNGKLSIIYLLLYIDYHIFDVLLVTKGNFCPSYFSTN